MAARRIRLNFVEKNCPTVDNIGMWTHPDSRPELYLDLEYWIGLARLLESARFDAVFFADALGTFSTYGNSRDTAVREGMSLPINDPLYLIPAMAAATEHLGFAVTSSITYDHPYALARKFSTLDHLTDGRVGWNIVTSNLDSAAQNFGLDEQLEHDRRYDRGDEFLEVCYKLWERSWEDGAVVRDPERGMFADPDKVRGIGHRGAFFRVPGIHLCEPSPQRTPVLFQAGSSARGRRFAALHAECIFLNAMTPEETKFIVDDVRAQAREAGRDPEDVLFFPRFVPVVGRTEREARERFDDYVEHVSTEGTLALLSSWSGIDFSAYGRDELLDFVKRKKHASQYIADYLQRVSAERPLSVPDLARLYAFGGIENVTVGSPEQVAERMIAFADYTGVDGFNIAYTVRPGGIRDFAELVVPELQRVGRVQRQYAEGTLRRKLFGAGDRLNGDHPGSRAAI